MSSIETSPKHSTLLDLKLVEKRLSLLLLNMESPAIKIVFLGQECALQL